MSSDDTHELGGEVGDTAANRVGDSALGLALGGDKFSFKSSFGPLWRLIFVDSKKEILHQSKKIQNIVKKKLDEEKIRQ